MLFDYGNQFQFVGIFLLGEMVKPKLFWYPKIGMVLHRRNPELENLVPSHL